MVNHYSLPPELTYAILKHLQDDKQSLSNCSLICSIWLPIAQSYLFHSIHITPTSSPRYGEHDNTVQRILLALGQSPHLSQYIQHLLITGASTVLRKRLDLAEELFPLLECLSSLRSLHLANVELTGPTGALPLLRSLWITRISEQDFPSVQHLDINSASWETDILGPTQFFSLFSQLRNLVINSIWSSDPEFFTSSLFSQVGCSEKAGTTTTVPGGSQLVSLTLMNSEMEFLELLAPFTQNLSSFSCEVYNEDGWTKPHLLALLQNTSHSMTNFALKIWSIDFNELDNGTRELHQLLCSTLPKSTSLRTFRIDIFNGFSGHDHLDSNTQWGFAVQCLEILASSPGMSGDMLERVIIGINRLSGTYNELRLRRDLDNTLDWGGLEAVLRRFRNLDVFMLATQSADEQVIWEEVATKKLPWLKEKLMVSEDVNQWLIPSLINNCHSYAVADTPG